MRRCTAEDANASLVQFQIDRRVVRLAEAMMRPGFAAVLPCRGNTAENPTDISHCAGKFWRVEG